MLPMLKRLDQLLRHELTRPEQIAADPQRGFDLPLFFMGWFALTLSWGQGTSKGWMQLFAGMVKLPALFLLTLLVTFPSLYIFSALLGTRLGFVAILRMLVASIVVTLALAAAFGTIVGFFTLSTTSYHFMVLLNVALLAIAGLVGVGFLLKTLRDIGEAQRQDRIRSDTAYNDALRAAAESGRPPPPYREPDQASNAIVYVWIVIYGLVGMQMGWLLRPFIGHPDAPFEWFRQRQGNVFQSILHHLQQLLGA
jgi:hypothetical protein